MAIWTDETDVHVRGVQGTMGYWCFQCHIMHYASDFEYDRHMAVRAYDPMWRPLPERERLYRALVPMPELPRTPAPSWRSTAGHVVSAIVLAVALVLVLIHPSLR